MNLLTPADGCFRPGSTVSGTIRYTLHSDQIFKKIIISLKGHGILKMTTRYGKYNTTYRNNEQYVNIDYVIYTNVKKAPLPSGSYETQFSFTLPLNIPSSLKYLKQLSRYTVRCNVLYYIGIKFEKPFLQFNTQFNKNIRVLSGIIPKLSTTPTICGEQKTLTSISRLFSSKKNIIKIKAIIQNRVLQPGGKIDINLEVSNDTDVVIKEVQTKLIEIYNFSAGGHVATTGEYVPGTYTKTGSIACGDLQNMDVAINVPVDRNSLEHSKIVTREYSVLIQVILPVPHRNAMLRIPVQIDTEIDAGMCAVSIDDPPPPSYWEAMAVATKDKPDDDNDADEDDCDDSKYTKEK